MVGLEISLSIRDQGIQFPFLREGRLAFDEISLMDDCCMLTKSKLGNKPRPWAVNTMGCV